MRVEGGGGKPGPPNVAKLDTIRRRLDSRLINDGHPAALGLLRVKTTGTDLAEDLPDRERTVSPPEGLEGGSDRSGPAYDSSPGVGGDSGSWGSQDSRGRGFGGSRESGGGGGTFDADPNGDPVFHDGGGRGHALRGLDVGGGEGGKDARDEDYAHNTPTEEDEAQWKGLHVRDLNKTMQSRPPPAPRGGDANRSILGDAAAAALSLRAADEGKEATGGWEGKTAGMGAMQDREDATTAVAAVAAVSPSSAVAEGAELAEGNDGGGGHQRGSSIADFDIIKVISKGGYGRVFLASLKEEEVYDDADTEGKKPQKKKKDYFAIKVMRRLRRSQSI